ncbi:hypothetical protein [Paenibacillus sp. Marseille-Q4541]|uniref:Shedu anti-phage system protein SduA domain-containing protein n=1 Tax=Paenibacillus sp. Marseille-Q4541 TaxID=2831522 RepID=UPI001BADEE32|nr:hypothetical protein [Paenibacillus sp. Marseille-Q4541]
MSISFKYHHSVIVESLLKEFNERFLKNVEKQITIYEQMGVVSNIRELLPEPFKSKSKSHVQLFYYPPKKTVFYVISKSDVDQVVVKFTDKDIFSKMKLIEFKSGVPSVPVTFVNTSIRTDEIYVNFDYSLYMSYEHFIDIFDSVDQYSIDFVNSYVYSDRQINVDRNYSNQFLLVDYLTQVKNEMKTLVFNPSTPELDIDNFFERHPVVLEKTLNLIKPIHQSILKNINNCNPVDYKPDLIAYDQLRHQWKIVDYKRAKRSILKNVGQVRSGFKAEVNDLHNQLRDYVEYFDDRSQREYFKAQYGELIEYPASLGIIGHIQDNEKSTFHRTMRGYSNGFDIIPYNFIYDRFCKFIFQVENVQ